MPEKRHARTFISRALKVTALAFFLFGGIVLILHIYLLINPPLVAPSLSGPEGTYGYIFRFTGGIVTWIAVTLIVAMAFTSQARSLRVLRLLFTWISALFTGIYVMMIQTTQMSRLSGISWETYYPLDRGSYGLALSLTGILCIAFAIYTTIRARRDHEAIIRVLLGPLPYAGVVGVVFAAKELMFTNHVIRDPQGWNHVAELLWLSPLILVACAFIAQRIATDAPPSQMRSGLTPLT